MRSMNLLKQEEKSHSKYQKRTDLQSLDFLSNSWRSVPRLTFFYHILFSSHAYPQGYSLQLPHQIWKNSPAFLSTGRTAIYTTTTTIVPATALINVTPAAQVVMILAAEDSTPRM